MTYYCLECNTTFNRYNCTMPKCDNNHTSQILTLDAYNKLQHIGTSGIRCTYFVCNDFSTTSVNNTKFNTCRVKNIDVSNIKICPKGLWKRD